MDYLRKKYSALSSSRHVLSLQQGLSEGRGLYLGDNLEWMRKLVKIKPEGCIDLCYIDPPFNSGKRYLATFKKNTKERPLQQEAFVDLWTKMSSKKEIITLRSLGYKDSALYLQVLSKMYRRRPENVNYLGSMALRLAYIHKLLNPTGSLYLHCDPSISHYLKLLCDTIFGEKNFRSEIVWWYRKFGQGSRNFKKNHDIILYYAKDYRKIFFAEQFEAFSPRTQKDKYKRIVVNGRWIQDKKVPMREVRKEDGVPMSNTWEVSFLNSQSKERKGYPTQKPLALLERILGASSQVGDLVVDFFAGSGSTINACETLGRKWLAFDSSPLSVALIREELRRRYEQPSVVVGGLAQTTDLLKKMSTTYPHLITAYLGGVTTDSSSSGERYLCVDRKYFRQLIVIRLGSFSLIELQSAIKKASSQGSLLLFVAPAARITKEMLLAANTAGKLTTKQKDLYYCRLLSLEDLLKGCDPESQQVATFIK